MWICTGYQIVPSRNDLVVLLSHLRALICGRCALLYGPVDVLLSAQSNLHEKKVGSARQHSGPASLKNAPLNETWGDAGHTQPLPRPRVSACSSLAGVVQHAGHGGMLGMGECWAYPAAASVTRGCKALCPPVDEVGEQAVCPLLGLHCHDC